MVKENLKRFWSVLKSIASSPLKSLAVSAAFFLALYCYYLWVVNTHVPTEKPGFAIKTIMPALYFISMIWVYVAIWGAIANVKKDKSLKNQLTHFLYVVLAGVILFTLLMGLPVQEYVVWVLLP